MFNHGLLTAQRGRAAHPEHTCSKMSVGFIVLKHQGRLPAHGRQVERILHDHDNIDIVGFLLTRDEGPKNAEPGYLAGRARELVDPF